MIPLLSVCLITYNHVNYIKQAIEGVMLQQVNFPWELIIADDCSTDGTRQIVEAWQKEYPDFIKLILQKKNVGAAQNWMDLITYPQSKYIAYFEGDDYWKEPNKLQKQVDFLEANDGYAICFHRVYELTEGKEPELSNLNTSLNEETYTIEDLAKGNIIHTPSVVFRNGLFKEFPVWFKDSPVGDYVLHMLNARHGKIKYFPEPMAVYRRHSGGVFSSKSSEYVYIRWLKVLVYLMSEFEGNTKEILNKHHSQTLFRLAEIYKFNGEYDNLADILSTALCKDSTKTREWLMENYIPLLKQVNSFPKSIRGILKFLLKECRKKRISFITYCKYSLYYFFR